MPCLLQHEQKEEEEAIDLSLCVYLSQGEKGPLIYDPGAKKLLFSHSPSFALRRPDKRNGFFVVTATSAAAVSNGPKTGSSCYRRLLPQRLLPCPPVLSSRPSPVPELRHHQSRASFLLRGRLSPRSEEAFPFSCSVLSFPSSPRCCTSSSSCMRR